LAAHVRESDRKRTVAVLAEEFRAPFDDVAALYERERADLLRGARVTTFLDILAVRKVEDALRQRRRDTHMSTSGSTTLPAG